MGSFARVLGRFLFIAIFMISGFKKVSTPALITGQLTTNYVKFHKWAIQPIEAQLPPQISTLITPQNIQKYSEHIILFTGVFMFIFSTMILTTISGGGFLAFLFLALATAIFHNPYLQSTPQDTNKSYYEAAQNIALAGGALMMCCGFCSKKNEKQ